MYNDPQNNGIELAKEAIKQSFEVAKEFIGKLVNPALEETGGIIQNNIAFWRFKNQINIVLKAKKFLDKKGIDPKQVKKILPKTLLLILENGSLEEEDKIQDKWAALLANAADPNNKYSVNPSFAEILKELSPLEVELLDTMFDKVNQDEIANKTEIFFEKEEVCPNFYIEESQYTILVGNLLRLNLCQPVASRINTTQGVYPFGLRTCKFIGFTQLGYEFVKLCRF
ncbi:MAG: Abi-alpha family protein [bacterium]